MAETLRQKQSRFVRLVARLILHAEALGYELTVGDAYRDPRVTYGLANSLHRQRLAIDLHLFKDGIYQADSAAHRPLGEYWERLGGSWGGRFTPPDGNHYSLEHAGVR